MDLYPLTFRPVFRSYIWGGRRLGEVLHKPIGDEDRYAESWEVVDHGADQSVVAQGPLEGKSLAELIADYGSEIYGEAIHREDSFPLLLKYLDCNRVLSVQVHPDDAYGQQMDPPDLGKTEAWYVIDAEPDAKIYAGLADGVDREAFATAIRTGRVADVLHEIPAKAGECIFIPAGTVHALGAGILVAEIQQSSDTTFRVFDWDRLGKDGRPRPLHVDQALEVTDYQSGPVEPQRPQLKSDGTERLVACDKFFLDRIRGVEPRTIDGQGKFLILTTVAGGGTLTYQDEPIKMPLGQTVLVPAACRDLEYVPFSDGATLLVMGQP